MCNFHERASCFGANLFVGTDKRQNEMSCGIRGVCHAMWPGVLDPLVYMDLTSRRSIIAKTDSVSHARLWTYVLYRFLGLVDFICVPSPHVAAQVSRCTRVHITVLGLASFALVTIDRVSKIAWFLDCQVIDVCNFE